jgi:predicted peroxiredoxin
MASILVHLTHGPEHPTRAALAFLVAKAAIDDGHKVTMFLAGDAVQLMRDGVLDNLVGLGTGNLRELFNAIAASGSKIHLSGMSSKVRGLESQAVSGKPVEMATPNVLVKLALEHDKMFTY